MKNIKLIVGFSIFGFLLSFFSGLFSHASFGRVFFHAIGFAIIFGLLALAVQFVFEKFLDINGYESVSSSVGADSQSNKGFQNQKNAQKHSVDFYVEDEPLPSEENEEQFYVGNKHQMLSESDVDSGVEQDNSNNGESISLSDDVKNENLDSSGFVPISFGEAKPDSLTSVESKSIEEIKSNEKKFSSDESSINDSESLDVLPDLEQISNSVSSAGSHIENDSDEINDGSADSSMNIGPKKDTENIAEGQDAELMAKAISTLLSKDK